jgi:hypothetical protein
MLTAEDQPDTADSNACSQNILKSFLLHFQFILTASIIKVMIDIGGSEVL